MQLAANKTRAQPVQKSKLEVKKLKAPNLTLPIPFMGFQKRTPARKLCYQHQLLALSSGKCCCSPVTPSAVSRSRALLLLWVFNGFKHHVQGVGAGDVGAAGRALGAAAAPQHWLLLFAVSGWETDPKAPGLGTGERELLLNPKQVLQELQVHRSQSPQMVWPGRDSKAHPVQCPSLDRDTSH